MAMDLGTAIAYIDLDLSSFNQGIESVNSAISGLKNSVENGFSFTGMLDSIGTLATNVGGSLTKNLTVPIANFGKSALDSYIEYESAFTGVKKTLDTGNRTFEETEQLYKELSDAIQEMSTRTASTAPEIAEVAEVAGQLGISAEDLMKFTETMVMLGDTTNLSSTEAAESLAKFMNITGTSKQDVDKLGASIVDLGNHFATNESDIVRMATRLASAGTIAGLTERDILALSTAMSSVGINAEAGGSSMSQTLAQIEKAVQMSIAGDEGAIQMLDTLAKVSHMSAQEFSDAWTNDPMTALTNFLYGLGDLDEQGESTVLILDELGMTGIRQSNMLKALGLAAGELEKTVVTSNEAWEENTALMHEAELRYETTESRLEQLSNEYEILKREIAEILLPVLEQLMDYAKQLVEWFRNLDDGIKENIVKYAGIVAAVGPVLLIFGQLVTSVSGIIKGFTALGGIAAPVITGIGSVASPVIQGLLNGVKGLLHPFRSLKEIVGSVKGIFQGFVSVLSGSKSPMDLLKSGLGGLKSAFEVLKSNTGLATAAIGLLVAGFVKAYSESATFRDALKRLFEVVLEAGQKVWEFFKSLWAAFKPVIDMVVDLIAKLLEALLPPLVDLLESIMGLLDALMPVIEFIVGLLGTLAQIVGAVLSPILEALGLIFGSLIEDISKAIDVISQFIDWIKKLFEPIGEFFGKVKDAVSDFFGWTKGEMKKSGKAAVDGFAEGIDGSAKNGMKAVEGFGKNIAESFKSSLEIHSPSQLFRRFGSQTVDGYVEGVQDKEPEATRTMNGMGNSVFQSFNDAAMSKMALMVPMVSDAFNNLDIVLNRTAISLKYTGQTMFDGFFSAIQSAWNTINRWVSNAVNGIMNAVNNVFNAVRRIGGSHANGLDFVPYDGYVAELHKGERVLTKEENREYNEGMNGDGSRSGDTFNFYNTKPDPYEYARQMKRAKRELNFGY